MISKSHKQGEGQNRGTLGHIVVKNPVYYNLGFFICLMNKHYNFYYLSVSADMKKILSVLANKETEIIGLYLYQPIWKKAYRSTADKPAS